MKINPDECTALLDIEEEPKELRIKEHLPLPEEAITEEDASEDNSRKIKPHRSPESKGPNFYIAGEISAPLKGEELEQIVRLAKEGNEFAKEELVKSLVPLSMNVAQMYASSRPMRNLNFWDLVQEANIGIVNAIEKYEFGKGATFPTYARFWIDQKIRLALKKKNDTIRVPVHVHNKNGDIAKYIRETNQTYGEAPSDEELLKAGFKAKEVRLYRETSVETCISLETEVGEDSTLGSLIADARSPDGEQILAKKQRSAIVEAVLEPLDDRSKDIIRMRYGIGQKAPMTLEEVAKHYNLTRERIRQIEAQAFLKINHPSRQDNLRKIKDDYISSSI